MWSIDAPYIGVNIGLGNGWLLIWQQAIITTINVDLQPIKPWVIFWLKFVT